MAYSHFSGLSQSGSTKRLLTEGENSPAKRFHFVNYNDVHLTDELLVECKTSKHLPIDEMSEFDEINYTAKRNRILHEVETMETIKNNINWKDYITKQDTLFCCTINDCAFKSNFRANTKRHIHIHFKVKSICLVCGRNFSNGSSFFSRHVKGHIKPQMVYVQNGKIVEKVPYTDFMLQQCKLLTRDMPGKYTNYILNSQMS